MWGERDDSDCFRNERLVFASALISHRGFRPVLHLECHDQFNEDEKRETTDMGHSVLEFFMFLPFQ